MSTEGRVEAFIQRWANVQASELSTAQTFVSQLCDLLGVPQPHATVEQDYMFERPVTFAHPDGSTSAGRIDCYKRGHFVIESKKVRAGAASKRFDDALLRAMTQGVNYVRALPAAEGRPPFVVVVDVGRVIELYAEFTRSGGTYTPYPDPRSHRIKLQDLRNADIRRRLKALWLDPMSLDPSRANARVTKEVAVQLAGVARSLEEDGHSAHDVAAFLTRCLFSMFAEDVGLLPRVAGGDGAFVDLLRRFADDPTTLEHMMGALWGDMDRGGFSAVLARKVLRFNGKLFKNPGVPGYTLPLKKEQIDGLLAAASASWREVEPAIFGTLLERALSPRERHSLGAHYTPRSYVERLVLPAIVEPLRAEWSDAQAAAMLLANEANDLEGKRRDEKLDQARAELRRFHHRLCTVKILDPACGSGNFLYVTLEHLKRLEGEVLNQFEALGDTQERLDLHGETVTVQQLLGIEVNERAASLAELVLWIGYLQWQLRTFGSTSWAEPVVHDYGNIEFRDAVLAYGQRVQSKDEDGNLLVRWDGVTYKAHPVTGQKIPDESSTVPVWTITKPERAKWPEADFIIGNPPFIGNKRMREVLGDGYVAALRKAYPDVPESADYVMYWWSKAADLVRTDKVLQFGLITTNSLTMIFNRKVVEAHQTAEPPLGLVFAVPDHPWVDAAEGAAVRIAMTVGHKGLSSGRLLQSTQEEDRDDGEVDVTFSQRFGVIHADLRVGVDTASAKTLLANAKLSNRGVIPHGAGFLLTPDQAASLGAGRDKALDARIRPYRNGKDLTSTPRGVQVIDTFGMSLDDLRTELPAVFQWLLERVKPERDHNPRPKRRENWWRFAEDQPRMRQALKGLKRYIATGQVAKHRTFQWLDGAILADDKLITIASDDSLHLGVLSSRVHTVWAQATGGRLGIGNDLVYSKSSCFETFPFPGPDTGLTSVLAKEIRKVADQLDAHRKTRQAACPGLTLTAMYNVLEKVRAGVALDAKEAEVHKQGLCAVLLSLHEELDTKVEKAYGINIQGKQLDDETILGHLLMLNEQRAREEAAGVIRWMRPAFQKQDTPRQVVPVNDDGDGDLVEKTPSSRTQIVVPPSSKRPWPAGLPEQIKAVAEVLGSTAQPLPLDAIANTFTARGRWRDRLPTILSTLEALGRARKVSNDRWGGARHHV